MFPLFVDMMGVFHFLNQYNEFSSGLNTPYMELTRGNIQFLLVDLKIMIIYAGKLLYKRVFYIGDGGRGRGGKKYKWPTDNKGNSIA